MSVAEFRGPQGGDERNPELGFDRTPPQDLAAEQCVLGAMLLSKDAIADVSETIRGTDFYRPAHEVVYDAITDLYARGEPADAITVAAELTKRGEIARIGGAPYLHTLVASVPVAANAGYYAHIVREKSILRRLVEAGTKIVQTAYAGEGQVDDVVDNAQAEVYAVTERRTSEDYAPIASMLEATIEEIEAIAGRGGSLTGVPTGFADLDELTNGLHPGQMVIIAGRPAMGKALALDTPLPTPTGWTTMGDVQVGEYLLGADGRPTKVTAATEVMYDRPCYEVEFSDGEVIVADAEHLWATTTRAARRATSERRSKAYYWPADDVQRVVRLADAAARQPDQLVSVTELIRETGGVFENVLRGTVVAQVPQQGRMSRSFERRTRRLPAEAVAAIRESSHKSRTYRSLADLFGVSERTIRRAYVRHVAAAPERRPYLWPTPVYSRQALFNALAVRVSRPVNSWLAHSHDQIVTTAEIAASLRHANRTEARLNHAVATCRPLNLPEHRLPLSPYLLGVWLGDGTSIAAQITSADPEVAEHLRCDGYRVAPLKGRYAYSVQLPEAPPLTARDCVVCGRAFVPKGLLVRTCGLSCGGRAKGVPATFSPAVCTQCGKPLHGRRTDYCPPCWASAGTVQARLRSLGVLGNKHIPPAYLRASEQQRRALLAGLLDTDGTVAPNGGVQFTVTSRRLAEDFRELVTSLGYRSRIATRPARGRTVASSTAYTVNFSTADDVFRLTRKRDAHKRRYHPKTTLAGSRFITAVRPVPAVPVRCVQVDSPDHLYLAGRSMVPTHNSTLGLDFARSASIKHGLTSVIFSLEMSRTEITMRLLSAEAKVPLHHMRNGKMSDEDWAKLAGKVGEVSEAPLFIDDSPNMTMMEIRAKARRLKQRHDLRLIIVDYLQLMSSGKKVESRQVEVAEFSRSIKLLAKELGTPIIAVCQLNRGAEQRTDKRPLLSDLRETGQLEQDADVVILLHREDAYERESSRPGEADLIVAKHRNGPTATVTVCFQGHYSRFTDMAAET